ncbi:MAG: S-layer homology domain-containing protein [Clostridia bacterium]|nr:S-layer homology domain-containing protein [Clostridia bacterium]
MKKRIVSLLLAVIMIAGMMPLNAFAQDADAVWAGVMNFNDANNRVTDKSVVTKANMTELKWQYPLNTTVENYSVYYAGSQVIIGEYLYAAGGNKLHKINIADGTMAASVDVPASAKLNEIQYLCYGNGMLYFAIRESITAFSISDLSQKWQVEGEFGQYHPLQYLEYNNEGFIWCNGNVFKASTGEKIIIKQKDSDEALLISDFAWSAGAQNGGYFYVTDKNNIYSIDMGTWKIKDQINYFIDKTSSYNTSGQVAFDSVSNRLFWGCKNYYSKNLYSVKLGENGSFAADSLIVTEAGFNSVNAPVIYKNRVYLIGQGKPFAAVFDINTENDTISRAYTAGDSSVTVQSNALLSTAGGVPHVYFIGFDGKIYMLEDNGETGTVTALAQTPNPSEVPYPNSYEPFAIDNNGNIYCYNESGYLFCYGKSACEIPTITKDLSTERVKYAVGDENAAPLTVEATISEGAGALSYQWQSSEDKKNWTDIKNEITASFTPSAAEANETYYRCVITNTQDGKTAKATSSVAHILVKVLSNNASLNILANTVNKLDGGIAGKKIDGTNIAAVENFEGTLKYLALGAVEEGTFEPLKDNITLYQGLPAGTKLSSPGNVSNSELYTRRYWRSAGFSLPFVASVDVTAEDGTEGIAYIVVDNDALSSYAIEVNDITSEDTKYNNDTNTISFTSVNETVALAPVTTTIGTGDEDKTAYTWTSSDTTVAVVNSDGVVKCIGGGEATVTFTCGQLTASVRVTSSAPAHNIHTYGEDDKCTVCGTEAPAPVAAYFTLMDADGKFVISKDGTTEIYKASLTVEDKDCDGKLTLNDAFIELHEIHSANGTADFATEESSFGPYITKLWGKDATVGVGYYHNNASAMGITEELKKNDVVTAYFYRDLTGWSDVYTYIEGQTVVGAKFENEYTVKGVAGGNAVIPEGATVKVFDSENKEVSSMQTAVNAEGKVVLVFENAGNYTIEVSGKADYNGSKWDTATNGYVDARFEDAPVIPSRFAVEVKPYAEKTAYISISMKNGEFAVNKNGDTMYYFPVTVKDDPVKPDGNISIAELLTTAHVQYHADGASAAGGVSNGFITKLWGESNGGNCSYYFNDVYMNGSGTKTGSNGREFQDKLLNTVVENGDHYYIYSFQTTDWTKGDLYTYFNPVSESATAGTTKTFTLKSGGVGSNKLETTLVKVYDSEGKLLDNLSTTVAADGTFSISFPEQGTYTVDTRTNGTNFVTPARLTVEVSPASSGITETVSVKVYDPQGKTYFEDYVKYEAGMTAYSALHKTGLDVKTSNHTEYGVYIEKIEDLGEFDEGATSGWMYKVNGEFPDCSSDLYTLSAGDEVEWVYTRDLGEDVGDDYRGSTVTKTDITEIFTDVENHWGIDAINFVYDKNIMTGTGDTTFEPDAVLSRGMLATVLYRLAGSPEVTAENPFPDVKADEWYTDAVIWAYENKIVKGYDNGNFGPMDSITREQFALMLMNYAQFKGIDTSAKNDLSQFADADDTSLWAQSAMQWAVAEGYITGRDTGLAPKMSANRAETATILMRFMENK